MKNTILSASILLLALILISLNLRPALTSIAPVMERIVDDLSLSRATAGLVTTIPVLLMGLLAPLAPMLARRWSQEKVLVGSMGLLGIALGLRYYSQHSFVFLLFSAFLAGVAIALAGPLMSGFIKQHFSKHMGFTIAVYSVSITAGALIAVAFTIPIVNIADGHWERGLASWGLLAFFTFLFLIIFLPKQKKESKISSVHHKLPLRSPRAWLLTAFFAAQAGVFYALATWLVAHFEVAGFTPVDASLFASAFMGCGILGALVLPILASRVSNHSWLIAGVTSGTTILILSMAWQPQWHPMLVVSCLGISTSGTFALALALPVLESETPQAASQLSSMMSSFGYIIGGITPSLIGIGRDITQSFAGPFSFLALLSIAMVVIAIVLPKAPINSAQ